MSFTVTPSVYDKAAFNSFVSSVISVPSKKALLNSLSLGSFSLRYNSAVFNSNLFFISELISSFISCASSRKGDFLSIRNPLLLPRIPVSICAECCKF